MESVQDAFSDTFPQMRESQNLTTELESRQYSRTYEGVQAPAEQEIRDRKKPP